MEVTSQVITELPSTVYIAKVKFKGLIYSLIIQFALLTCLFTSFSSLTDADGNHQMLPLHPKRPDVHPKLSKVSILDC